MGGQVGKWMTGLVGGGMEGGRKGWTIRWMDGSVNSQREGGLGPGQIQS